MKGRQIPYSDAEISWLQANCTMPIREYHAAFNASFERDVSADNLHALRVRRGWKTGRTGRIEKGNVPLNKGVPCAPGTGGRHPNARRTQFKKGNLPHNTRYLGHERVSKDGYVEISVAETNPHTGFERRYVLKHRHLWEQANGPVPEGMALKCLDSNKLNTDPTNWETVPRAILPRLAGGRRKNKLAYDRAEPELKPIVMAAARLEHGARAARKAARSPT